MLRIIFSSLALLLGILNVDAQINNLETKIVGVWYFNKVTTMTGKTLSITRENIDTVHFYSDKTFKWIYNKDSISTGTWKIDNTIKGIRLKQNLTKEKIEWYKSYGVTDEDMGRIDLPRVIITMDSFSFLSATEGDGELITKYLKKRLIR